MDGGFSFLRGRRSVETPAKSAASALARPPAPTLIKVGLLGDTLVGKTSLMARFVEGTFDETQLPTQGVNFMEKGISLGGQDVTFSIWDIGGHADSEAMLPLVCNDAAALLLVFDLTRPETLDSLREWHRKARSLNKCAMPLLVGCKYDGLLDVPTADHAHVCSAAKQFAAAIDAPLIFCAPSVPINVANIFKVLLTRLFGLAPAVPVLRQPGEPLLIYETNQEEEVEHAGSNAARSRPAPSSSPAPPQRVGSFGHMGAACSSSTAACGV